MSTKQAISDAFEESFLAVPFQQQVLNCDHYELANDFRRILPKHQPILEAGCGSGRWVAWAVHQGWAATGVDWSEALCRVAREQTPGGKFVSADIGRMPFKDASFGSILALGSIEHTETGPGTILDEFHRVVAPDGIVIVTVPYLSPLRRFRRLLRQLLGKRDERCVGAPAPNRGMWAADFHPQPEDPSQDQFFQYVLSKRTMRKLYKAARFSIDREFVDFHDEGVLHTFGSIVGTYDHEHGRVRFTAVGRLLRTALPMSWVGHMLCYVVRPTSLAENSHSD